MQIIRDILVIYLNMWMKKKDNFEPLLITNEDKS